MQGERDPDAQAESEKGGKHVMLRGEDVYPITPHSKTVVSARIELYHIIYNHSNAKTSSLAENAKQITAISLLSSKLVRISLPNAYPVQTPVA